MGNLLIEKFERIGARAMLFDSPNQPGRIVRNGRRTISFDVVTDRHGEYFQIVAVPTQHTVEVLDVQPRENLAHCRLRARARPGYFVS